MKQARLDPQAMQLVAAPSDPPKQGPSAYRIVLIVVGACIVLPALVPLGAGAVLVGVHSTQRDLAALYHPSAYPADRGLGSGSPMRESLVSERRAA